MEPIGCISAASAAIALTTSTVKVAKLILDLKGGVKVVHEELDGLYEEVEALRTVVVNIGSCLDTGAVIRAVRKIQDQLPGSTIGDLDQHLVHCDHVVNRLGRVLEQIGPLKNNSILRRGIQFLKLDDHQDEISRLRQQMESHRSCLNLSLQGIFICQTLQSDERDQQALNDLHGKVDGLAEAIAQLNVGKRNMEATIQQAENVTEDETRLLQEMEIIRNSSMALQRRVTSEIRKRQSVVVHNRTAAASLASDKVMMWKTGQDEAGRTADEFAPSVPSNVLEPHSAAATSKFSHSSDLYNASSLDSQSASKHNLADSQVVERIKSDPGKLYTSSSTDYFEAAVTRVITEAELQKSRPDKPFSEETFTTLSRLLVRADKTSWSNLPRTYLVLRLIGQVNMMDDFVARGYKDINFPYSHERLPLSLQGKSAREDFLEKQSLVLSERTASLVRGGPHRHFNRTSDVGFDVIKTLGSGGHGVIDHVHSKLSLKDYARKRIPRRKFFSKDKRAVEMFENEIHNMKRLQHKHLVQFVGSYTDPRYVAIIMEPVADTDLRQYLSQPRFPDQHLANLTSFFGCLCSALCYLHSHSIRHKDIKPSNVLIQGNRVLITDFGVSRDWSEIGEEITSGNPGAFTRAYAAPEVHRHEPRDTSSDIWSLGCVYLDMLTILKGSTLERKRDFFSRLGSGSHEAWNNSDALKAWIDILEREDMEHNKPVRWIREMTSADSTQRPDAETLLHSIQNCTEGHQQYCCIDCSGDAASVDTSYRGSDTEDEDAVRIDSASASVVRKKSPLQSTTPFPTGDANTDFSADPLSLSSAMNSSSPVKKSKIPQLDFQNQREIRLGSKGAIIAGSIGPTQNLSQNLLDVIVEKKAGKINSSISESAIGAKPLDFSQSMERRHGTLISNEAPREPTSSNSTSTSRPSRNLTFGESPLSELIFGYFFSESDQLAAIISDIRERLPEWNKVLLTCVKPNETSQRFNTMLHLAANFEDVGLARDVVHLYLEAGTDPNVPNFASNTAIQCAAARDNSIIVQQLLPGSNLSHGNIRKQTTLHIACAKQSEASTAIIYEAMAIEEINLVDDQGFTALTLACRNGSLPLVKALLAKGADMTIVDKLERTCLHICHSSIWPQVSHLLREAKAAKREEAGFENEEEIPLNWSRGTGTARRSRQPSAWLNLGAEPQELAKACSCTICVIIRSIESLVDATGSAILKCPCLKHIKALCAEMLISEDVGIDEDMDTCSCRQCAITRATCGEGSTVVVPDPHPFCECHICRRKNETRYYRKDIVSLKTYKGHDYYDAKIAYAAPFVCKCKACQAETHLEIISLQDSVNMTIMPSDQPDPQKAWLDLAIYIRDHAFSDPTHGPLPDVFVDYVAYLLDLGANIDATAPRVSSMLWYAVASGHLGLSKLLVDRRAALNIRNDGTTLAETALYHCRPEFVRLLLRKGAKLDSWGKTLLHSVLDVYGQCAHMMPLILAHQPPLNNICPTGEVPLHQALFHRNARAVQLLIEAGADIEFSTKKVPRLLYSAIITDSLEGNADLTKVFLSKGVFAGMYADKVSPLTFASKICEGRKVVPIITALLGHTRVQAEVNETDRSGKTPLHWIAQANYEDTCSAVDVMLAAGAHIGLKDDSGSTPLHYAAESGNLFLTRHLVARSAVISVWNNKGKTPSDLAASKKHFEIVALLGGTLSKKKWYQRG